MLEIVGRYNILIAVMRACMSYQHIITHLCIEDARDVTLTHISIHYITDANSPFKHNIQTTHIAHCNTHSYQRTSTSTQLLK